MAHEPQLDADLVRKELENLCRSPFMRELAKVLMSAPSPEAIKAQADKYPDRWGQLLTMLSRLSGFTEKLEIDSNTNLRVTELSDSELMQRLEELNAKVPQMPGPSLPTSGTDKDRQQEP